MRNKAPRVPAGWLILVGALLLIMVPGTVVAVGGTFTDDDTSIFESNIEWLAAAGVTAGCNPPANDNFCPNDNVSRGQMAAFMQRFAQFLGAEDGTPAEADHATTASFADQADHATTASFADQADMAADAANAAALGGVDAVDVLPGGTLPAGTVLRGSLNVGATATAVGDLATSDISYGYDMGSPLVVVIIDAFDTPPTTCPGTVAEPAADPGYLCIFAEIEVNTTMGANQSRSYGVTVFTRSDAAGDFYSAANWAATAPGPLPAAIPAPMPDSINGS